MGKWVPNDAGGRRVSVVQTGVAFSAAGGSASGGETGPAFNRRALGTRLNLQQMKSQINKGIDVLAGVPDLSARIGTIHGGILSGIVPQSLYSRSAI
jgi:hypothetical protein